MENKAKEYQRLPGRKRGLAGTSTLWLGPDHLLRVDSHGFAENYKRFYYRDIQSFLILPNTRQHSKLMIWTAAGLPLALLAWYLGGGWGIFLSCLAGLAGIMLAANWLRGPICECQLQTAVQTEILPSLGRIRAALKALRQLQGRIEAIQGRLGPEFVPNAAVIESAEAASGRPNDLPPLSRRRSSQLISQKERALPHSSGLSHAVLFGLLVVDAGLGIVNLSVNHLILTVAEVFLNLGLIVSVVVALIEQARTDIGRFVRWQVLASLGYVGASFLIGSAYSLVLATRNHGRMESQWDRIVTASQTSAQSSPWLMGMIAFQIIASLAIAIPGWIRLARFWTQTASRRTRSEPE